MSPILGDPLAHSSAAARLVRSSGRTEGRVLLTSWPADRGPHWFPKLAEILRAVNIGDVAVRAPRRPQPERGLLPPLVYCAGGRRGRTGSPRSQRGLHACTPTNGGQTRIAV